MLISMKGFSGMIPRRDPMMLPDSAAQVALNTKFWRQTLQAFRSPLAVASQTKGGTIQSIYRFGRNQPETSFWFQWTTDVNCVRGPVAGDSAERTYFTGDGLPKVTDVSLALQGGGQEYPINSYTLGVPKPANAANVARNESLGTGSDTAESRVYVYTWVTAWGEEGMPSDSSNSIDMKVGNTATISGMALPPTGQWNLVAKRIYRASVGNTSVAYQFVAEVGAGTQTYVDSRTQDQLGETLSTLNFDMPDPAMSGLIALPNACLAGFVKNEVCFSEPGFPHAWPLKYRLTTEFDIIGLGNFGNTVVVLTTGNPYLATGVEPESMSMQKMEAQHSCVSKRSIVCAGDCVLYASPDGLVAVGSDGVDLITRELFTRDDWQNFKPASISAYYYEGRYVAFYNNGTTQGGFIIDPKERQFYDLSVYATAGYNDLINDALFLMVDSNVVKWEGSGAAMLYTWKSKKFLLPRYVNFSCAQVQANTYNNLLVRIYADGALKHVQAVLDNSPFRLPSGYLSKSWEFEIVSTDPVIEMHVATSIAELKDI